MTEDGEERIKPMIIPPVDPATGKTVGIEAVNSGVSVGGGTGTSVRSSGITAVAATDADASPAAPLWSPSREPAREGGGKRRLSAGVAGAAGDADTAISKRPRQEQQSESSQV